jgi:hypothetical protein
MSNFGVRGVGTKFWHCAVKILWSVHDIGVQGIHI